MRSAAAWSVHRAAAIARRELRAYFTTPVAFIVVVFFLVVTSAWFFFAQQFFAQDTATLRGYFSLWPVVFILLLPALTMRSWAEERRQGTAEILLTLPLREGELVAGKFAAAAALLLVLTLLTLPLPLSLLPFGSFDAGQIAMQYLGVLLLGCAGIAAGQFVSSLSANQISAFLFGVLFMLVITLIGQIPSVAVLPGWLAAVLSWISFDYHFDSFSKGVLDTRDLVFFAVLTAGFLLFTAKVLLLRRYR
ncbi:MAG: ABC transporter permease [Spirochaetia bacterium]|jgi:ABC-2 type transport system permease protein